MEHIEPLNFYLKKNNIQVIKITDKEYPEKLKQIYDAPKTLYIKGEKNVLNETGIAIIGARMCSIYGKNVTEKFSYDLAKRKIVTISGLARGIDTACHMGTVRAKGKTIAVLGSGIDIIYPGENKLLAEEIIKNGGAIISEFPIGMRPLPTNFPRRNRIISGLSDGVVVVEAKQKSGTFITVDFALEQGKEVYAVPGNINSITSTGTNELIKQGAKVVTSVKDILEDINFC